MHARYLLQSNILRIQTATGLCKQPPCAITDTSIDKAVDLWLTNETEAAAWYGDISEWDTSAVSDTAYLFSNAKSFNANISSWNMTGVQNAAGMFSGASKFNSDLSRWRLPSLQTACMMFAQASSFNSNLSGWRLLSLQDMSGMFSGTNISHCQKHEILAAWPKTFRPFTVDGKNYTELQGWAAYEKDWALFCPWGSRHNITCPRGHEKSVNDHTKEEHCLKCQGAQNQYTLCNIKCHSCPMGGDCALGGYEVRVAQEGAFWQGQPFFKTCMSLSTYDWLT